MKLRTGVRFSAVVAAAMALSGTAGAQSVFWTNWTAISPNANATTPGSATGTIAAPGGPIGVSYTGEADAGSQTSGGGGNNYWQPAATFNGGVAGNEPSNNGFIQLTGGNQLTNTITFAAPVHNVFISILSLGQGGNTVSYTFSNPFTIVSQGAEAYYGGCSSCLTETGNTVSGTEGDGTLMFAGNFTSLSFTISGNEFYHGITVGVAGPATTTTPEPSSMALIGTGLFGLVPMVRRRRK